MENDKIIVYNLIIDNCGNYDENPIIKTFSTYEKALLTMLQNIKGKKSLIEMDVKSRNDYEQTALVRATTLWELGDEEAYTEYGFTTDKTIHYRYDDIYEIVKGEIL